MHTPFSRCYQQQGVSISALLAALDCLDYAVIADHNTFEGYFRLCEAKRQQTTKLFPGVQLLLPGGFAGIYLLVILNPHLGPVELEFFLRQLGLRETDAGDSGAMVSLSMPQVAELVRQYDALAVWTDLHGSQGVLKAVDRQQQQAIFALGWPGNLLDWNTELHPESKLYPVWSSNAHCLADIGRLTTGIKVESLDFPGLKYALTNYHGRIQAGDTLGQDRRPQVLSVQVNGGFLQGEFNFNSGLNCIVGPRGAGKTTLLTLLHFALDGPEVPEMQGLLGAGEVQVRLFDGKEYLQVRRKLGQAALVLDKFGRRRTPKLGDFISYYSQGEIERVVLRPEVQLELLDSLWESGAAQEERTALALALKQNGNRLGLLEQGLAQLEEQLLGKFELERRLTEVKNLPLKDIQEKLVQRQRELFSLSQARQLILQQQRTRFNPTGLSLQGIPEFMLGFLQRNQELELVHRQLWLEAEAALDVFSSEVEQRHQEITGEYQKLLGSFSDRRVQELVREREIIQAELIKLEPQEQLYRELQEELHCCMQERKQLLTDWRTLKQEILNRRQQAAHRINQELLGSIRVEVVAEGILQPYLKLLADALPAVGPATQKVLYQTSPPEQLLSWVENSDAAGLAQSTGLTPHVANRILGLLSLPETHRALETLDLSDRVTIFLQEGDTEKSGSQLSTGQRCTAVLPLLFLAAQRPLVIDQPEDQLDNAYVYEVIVKRIKELKENRQFILVTHNPNIPVLADAEQIIVLQANGQQGRTYSCGSIENNQVKEAIQRIMEGGKDAFKRRAQCYGQLAP